jgi:hypothetical protein
MIPIIDELDALKNAMDTETTLRKATETEFSQGNTNGVMRKAHDESVQAVIEAAKRLIEKSEKQY